MNAEKIRSLILGSVIFSFFMPQALFDIFDSQIIQTMWEDSKQGC